VSSPGPEHLARAAYEAHRAAVRGAPLPPWEDVSEQDRQPWRAAAAAVADQTGQAGKTVAEHVLAKSLLVQVGDERRTFTTEFTAGRQGTLLISDEFASNHHARFTTAHGRWYVEDLRSTNGTWLNGRRIHAAQYLRKGDQIWIGHTLVTVVSI
jgi:pSer/pThr/pTyr-binding forkhead associated (FHA) protein